MQKILDLREKTYSLTDREVRLGIFREYLPTGNENKVLHAVCSEVKYAIIDNNSDSNSDSNSELEEMLRAKGIATFYLVNRAGQIYLIETIPVKKQKYSSVVSIKKNIINLQKWLHESPNDQDYKLSMKKYKRELISLNISTYKRITKRKTRVG